MKYLAIFISGLAIVVMSSCANNNGGNFPQYVDAPPFDFPNGEELRSRMHQLAFSLRRLDAALGTDYEIQNAPSQDQIVSNLRDIDRIANTIQSRELETQHPFLVDEMTRFISDVEKAEWGASRGRYYMAGRVAGACVSCHKSTY
ncbi:hypothetical protein N9D02_00015 [Emcibacteraceae bacterium]|mgnify:CR=1 FL=1|nr:hypothetical protein [Emcibacteraceae bacterium]